MMADLFDYLSWRGDIPLSQVPLGPVDTLVLTTLAYVNFGNFVPGEPENGVEIAKAARAFLTLPREEQLLRVRCKAELELLEALIASPRFNGLTLSAYEDRLEEESELQFSAVAIDLGDGTRFLAYRGTDNSLVGWKEDFNLSFQDAIPAQWLARDYLERCAGWFDGELILGGHSKGGNLAVFAASMCRPQVAERVKAVYNHDGPGFGDLVMHSPGYLKLMPRIHSFVPESSVVGLLLEHREPYVVVKSRYIGIFQHDPYSWAVMGGDFVRLEEVSEGSKVLDQTVKTWVAGLTPQERGKIVDTIYDLFQTTEADRIQELIQPKNLLSILQAIRREEDQASLRQVAGALGKLVKTGVKTVRELKKES